MANSTEYKKILQIYPYLSKTLSGRSHTVSLSATLWKLISNLLRGQQDQRGIHNNGSGSNTTTTPVVYTLL